MKFYVLNQHSSLDFVSEPIPGFLPYNTSYIGNVQIGFGNDHDGISVESRKGLWKLFSNIYSKKPLLSYQQITGPQMKQYYVIYF